MAALRKNSENQHNGLTSFFGPSDLRELAWFETDLGIHRRVEFSGSFMMAGWLRHRDLAVLSAPCCRLRHEAVLHCRTCASPPTFSARRQGSRTIGTDCGKLRCVLAVPLKYAFETGFTEKAWRELLMSMVYW